MENNFLSLLRKKLSLKPSNQMDQAFWKKFDSEFKAKKSFRWNIWLPALGTAALALALFLTKTGMIGDKSDLIVAAEVLENQEMLDDMDMFLELDELAVDDEDWDILLDGENS